ncbi:MAG: DUF87 domain-containing protein [Pseudomonadota bacterium]
MTRAELTFAQAPDTTVSGTSLGRVVGQSSGRSIVLGQFGDGIRMGDRVVFSGVPQALGIVTGFEAPVGPTEAAKSDAVFVEVRTVGVLKTDGSAAKSAAQPSIGADAYRLPSSVETAEAAMGRPIAIGERHGGIPAVVDASSLLGRVLTITGDAVSGKSAALGILLRALLSNGFPARIVLIDPEGLFAQTFGQAACVVDGSEGLVSLPMMTNDEIVALVSAVGEPLSQPKEQCCYRMLRYAGAGADLEDLRDACGRLRSAEMADAQLYDGLGSRLRLLAEDQRYKAFAGAGMDAVTTESVLQKFFRLPDGRPPASVIQLNGLAPELRSLAASILMRLGLAVATGSNGAVPVIMALDGAEAMFRKLPDVRVSGFGLIASGEGLEPPASGITLLHRIRSKADRDNAVPEGEPLAEELMEVLPTLATGEAVLIDPDYPWPVRLTVADLPARALPRPAQQSQAPRDPQGLLSAIADACVRSAQG